MFFLEILTPLNLRPYIQIGQPILIFSILNFVSAVFKQHLIWCRSEVAFESENNDTQTDGGRYTTPKDPFCWRVFILHMFQNVIFEVFVHSRKLKKNTLQFVFIKFKFGIKQHWLIREDTLFYFSEKGENQLNQFQFDIYVLCSKCCYDTNQVSM